MDVVDVVVLLALGVDITAGYITVHEGGSIRKGVQGRNYFCFFFGFWVKEKVEQLFLLFNVKGLGGVFFRAGENGDRV